MAGSVSVSLSEEENFKKLYFDQFPKVVKIGLYITADQGAAEDLAQEVFVKLWQKREQLDKVGNLEAYIAQMMRNASLDYIKSNKRTETDSFPALAWEEEGNDRENELKKALEKALVHLAPQCRLIFSLSRFEGLTNQEIADYLSISIRTVETQISNALKSFRTDLRKYFIEFLGFLLLVGDFFLT